MFGERLAWILNNLDGAIEAGMLVGTFLPLIVVAAIVHHRRHRS